MRDAIVVGAGPAGAVAAAELARRGRDVLLVDRARFPRDKVCGGCLHPDAAAALGDAAAGAAPLERFDLRVAGRRATVPLPGWSALSRRALDARLVRGLEFRDGTTAELGPVVGDAREVLLDGAPERARIVLLADGVAGRLAGPPVRASHVGAGAVADAPLPGYGPGILHMACGRGGYAGVVRAEEGRTIVAAALAPALVRAAGGLGPAVARLLAETGGVPLPADLPWRGTPRLTRRPGPRFAERVLVLGDAGGYVEPFTGEGILWAAQSARAAAALAAAGWGPHTGRAWARAHRRVVGRRQLRCRVLTRALRRPALARALVFLLARAPAFAYPWTRTAT